MSHSYERVNASQASNARDLHTNTRLRLSDLPRADSMLKGGKSDTLWLEGQCCMAIGGPVSSCTCTCTGGTDPGIANALAMM